MWKNEGSFETPGFRGEYQEGYHNESKHFNVILVLPDGIAEQIGNGSLVVEIEVDIRQDDGWVKTLEFSQGDKFYLVEEVKEWAEAEEHCKSQGAQLASVLSEAELSEVKAIV